MKKVTLLVCSILLLVGGVQAQVQNVKIKGTIKGVDATQISLYTGPAGSVPEEIATTIIEKGKFEMVVKEDPKAGVRYALYIPMLDNESRNNDKSREYFFIDSPEITIEAKIKGNGFSEFQVIGSKMLEEFKTAYNNVDKKDYYRLADTMNKYFNDFQAFKAAKDESRTGVPMTEADSTEFKRLKALQSKATGDFFDEETALSIQVANMVNSVPSRGLNALVYDYFKGYAGEYTKIIIDKYLQFFDVNYLKSDYYLNDLYERHLRFEVKNKGAEIVDFDFVDKKGKTVRFGDYKGKFVYINMWDVRDPEYQKNIDAFEALAKKFSDNDKIVFINFNLNEDMSLWKEELKSQSGLKTVQWSVNNNREFYNTYSIGGTPRVIFIDANGRMLEFEMSIPFEAKTEQIIKDYINK